MTKTKHRQVAGGIVVNENTGYVLLVAQPNNVWSLPKGGVDVGEDSITAARREILEESGLTEIHLVKELGTYKRFRIGKDGKDDESEMKDITIYLFTTKQELLKPIDTWHSEAVWFEREEVKKMLTHERDVAFYKEHLHELPLNGDK